MTEIDYGLLNEHAQKLYESAFQDGRAAGDAAGESRIAERDLRAGVDMAVTLLGSSISARDCFTDKTKSHARPGDDWPERVLALYARKILGRVSATSDVMRALDLLKSANLNNGPGEIDRGKVDAAYKHLKTYLETLGGYQ